MSAQILLLGAYFVCLIRSGVNYLVAIDKQNTVLMNVLLSLGLNIGLCYVLVKAGFGIEGIAVGLSVSGIVLTTLIWRTVFKELKLFFAQQFRELFYLYLPFIVCCLWVVCAIMFRHAVLYSLSPLLGNAIAAIAFALAYSGTILILPPLCTWSQGLVLRMRSVIMRRS
jgi:O-antigen/teichoic acid export membrane protein